MTPDPIAVFEAAVTQTKTMADGSPRFEFECSEKAIEYMTPLARAKADKRYLMVIVYDYEDFKRMEQE
jgi:hypothetical protein